MSFSAEALANAPIRALRAYDPGHDLPSLRRRFGAALAELGSNENPLGPSPRVVEAITRALAEISRYPDPRGMALKAALATRLGVMTEQITLGAGSHELLMLVAQCFAGPGTSVVFSEFGFAVFPIAAAAVGAEPIQVPARPCTDPHMPRGHDVAALAAAVRPDTRLVYLANPNNPTGTWIDGAALAAFLARMPSHTLVIVDEAYAEYTTAPELTSAIALLPQYPNLLVTRTFSKAHALAGLRVGYALSTPGVAAILERLRESFNVNSLALVAAEAALGDPAHVAKVRAWNARERAWLTEQLRARGYTVPASQTNFVLIDFGQDAAPVEHALYEAGVVVRPMHGYGLPTCLRVSVGTRVDNERLLAALS